MSKRRRRWVKRCSDSAVGQKNVKSVILKGIRCNVSSSVGYYKSKNRRDIYYLDEEHPTIFHSKGVKNVKV